MTQFPSPPSTAISTAPTYHFPGVPEPFKHQLETFNWIINNPRCFVFDDIGTGKTFSAAWATHYLMREGQVNRALVIAPVSTLNVVWKRTFFHVDPALDVRILKGTAAQKRYLYESCTHGIRIINPDSLHILVDAKCDPYDMIVVDESAMFRAQKARRSKALKALTDLQNKVKRIVTRIDEDDHETVCKVLRNK